MIASSGRLMQLLKIRIAQHQAIVGIPQYEGFRDGLDGVAQPHVGGDSFLDQVLLLGDVDGDADQMQARLAGLAHQLAARAQPYPVAVGVAHAEGVIDCGRSRIGEFGRELVEPHVVRMHQRIDIAERQQIVLGLEPEDFEHRLRPEDAAAGEVPIPQPAAATVERGIDAAADRFIDQVRFPRPCRLPMEGEAEDEHDEAGGGRQGDGQGGERAPRSKCRLPRLHHRELAKRGVEHAHGRQRSRCRRAA